MPRKESLSNGSQDLPAAADFASRLRDVMDQSGLSSNDVARRVRAKLPKGDSFAASNLSHYRRGRSVPRAKYLIALSSVLGVKPADLLPGGENDDAAGDNGTAPASRRTPSRRKRTRREAPASRADEELGAEATTHILAIEDRGELVRFRFDQLVTWEVALSILKILKNIDAAA